MTEIELTRIIKLFGRNVFQTAYCYMKNYADADDIQQETFIKLYTYGKTFESDEHIKAWLLRVTINLCKNRLNSAWYRLSAPIEAAESMPAKTESESIIPYLFRLKPKYRVALYMHYYEGYSAKDIARIYDSKETTVLSWLARGRKQLRDILIKEGYDELQ